MAERRKPAVFSIHPSRPLKTHLFQPGQKKFVGRRKGTPNRIPATIKDAILTALEIYGSDGSGKDGMIGYFYTIAGENRDLMVRLVEKILPFQLTGVNNGPIAITTIPQEMLDQCTTDQLTALKRIFDMMIEYQRSRALPGSVTIDGDATAYAAAIDGDETKH